jgi:hypothetical protein
MFFFKNTCNLVTEFIDLTKKHGKAAAGKVLEISEDEFNALANKHGGEVEKTVEVINVPGCNFVCSTTGTFFHDVSPSCISWCDGLSTVSTEINSV